MNKQFHIITRVIILSGVLNFLNTGLKGQNNSPHWLVMGVPQTLFQHGLRIDVDRHSTGSRNWWVFSPQYFVNTTGEDNLSYTLYKQMHGFGLSVSRKTFFSKKAMDQGIYISGGLGYQHFDMLTNEGKWIDVVRDGLHYLELSNEYCHVYINRLLTQAIIGYQAEITDHMYIDLFLGVGLNYSSYNHDNGISLKFNKSMVDYGYTGTVIIGGFRLGVGF